MHIDDAKFFVTRPSEENPREKINLCILILVSTIIFLIGLGVGLLVRRGCGEGRDTDGERTSRGLQDEVGGEFMKQQQRLYCSRAHKAGSAANIRLAETMAVNWKSWGLTSIKLYKYQVNKTVINSRNPNVVRLLFNGSIVENFSTVELDGLLPRYHGYSTDGKAKGAFVFINYGLKKDLKILKDLKVKFCNRNTIGIVRLGFSNRAAKVKNIVSYCGDELPSGLLVYPDPWDYAVDVSNKSANPNNTHVYPDSWWLPGDAAVFGSMKMKSGLQSPELPSLDGIFNTVNFSKFLTPFPVQPISYNDAKLLFSFLDRTKVPVSWEKSLASFIESKYNYEIEMIIKNKIAEKTMVNVIGTIPGTIEKDRYVILGNHRDAWAFGASDPGSGTVILQQVVKILASAYKSRTFRPIRTIIFANWDGEEEGLLGSTEFTSQFSSELSQRCIAYVNMDCPIKGSWSFVARSTPLLSGTMIDSSKNVFISPGYSLFEDWRKKNPKLPEKLEPKVNSLGGGSDHNLFAYVLGVPSSYPEYRYNESLPSMPAYHTKYDNIDMMLRLVDPQLQHHAIVSKFVIDYIIRLSYEPFIPYSVLRLTELLLEKFPSLKQKLCTIPYVNESKYTDILHNQLMQLNTSAAILMKTMKTKKKELLDNPIKLRTINDVLLQLPRMFITRKGLPTRPYLRNILLSTRLINSYEGSIFTGVLDAVDLYDLDKVDLNVVLTQMSLLSNSLRQSIDLLKNSLVNLSY